ncbi:MAG: Uma2 family endonuclease [Planctomycetota bacterium]
MNMIAAEPPRTRRRTGEPVWELARVFPGQGCWTEGEYLALDRAQNMLVEYTDGFVEVLQMPTWEHQEIVVRLLEALREFIRPRKLGKALCAPLPFKLRDKVWREPDIVFVLAQHLADQDYPHHADLVVEVVSRGKEAQERDYAQKRRDYAAAGVSEYWIVDPRRSQITVLRLAGAHYVEHGVFRKGAKATSVLLPGFAVDVAAVFTDAK